MELLVVASDIERVARHFEIQRLCGQPRSLSHRAPTFSAAASTLKPDYMTTVVKGSLLSTAFRSDRVIDTEHKKTRLEWRLLFSLVPFPCFPPQKQTGPCSDHESLGTFQH
jgi:hypothetical protein